MNVEKEYCGHYHASDCLAESGCVWCCDRPFGDQCLPSARRYQCGEGAVLNHKGKQCSDLCQEYPNCGTCVTKNWCYFCTSEKKCMAPLETCEKGLVTTTCSSPPESTEEYVVLLETVLGSGGVGLLVGSLLLMALVKGRVWWHHWKKKKGGREETATLPVEEDTSVNESLCFMCYAAKPSVVYLPCHHVCSCEVCSERLRATQNGVCCPLCRGRIISMVSLPSLITEE